MLTAADAHYGRFDAGSLSGPVAKLLQAKIVELTDALRNFTFPVYPDQFRSQDGGCTEAIIPDEHVQQARALVN